MGTKELYWVNNNLDALGSVSEGEVEGHRFESIARPGSNLRKIDGSIHWDQLTTEDFIFELFHIRGWDILVLIASFQIILESSSFFGGMDVNLEAKTPQTWLQH